MIVVFRLRDTTSMSIAKKLSLEFNVLMSGDGRDFIIEGDTDSLFLTYRKLLSHDLIDKDHDSFRHMVVFPHMVVLQTHPELKIEKFAVFILEMISTPATRDAVIGDLIEARDKIKAQHGERKARIYFWWQVSRTIGHFAWAWVRRLRWIAVALGFLGWVARKFSS